jgi:8-oxo-dGTP diphosphatase
VDELIDEHAIRDRARQEDVTHFATGIAIFRDEKLLVVRRQVNDFLGGMFELPGGGVNEDETISEGAIRETLEETGLEVSSIVGTFDGFDYETKTKPKVRQINFKVKVKPGEVTLEPTEHYEYRWIMEDDIDRLETTNLMRDCLYQAFA